MKDTANHQNQQTPQNEERTKNTMKTNITRRFLQATLGAVLATGIVVSGSAYAERGMDFKAAPEKPIEEYVLTEFRIDDGGRGDSIIGLKADGDTTVGGASGLKSPTGGANGNTGHGAADDFKAGPGCSIQCITSGVAYARGPNAKLVVKTDTEARIWIHVQGPNGYYRVQDSGATEVMEFGALFDDLNAGTTYTAWAVAKDKQNYESEAHGGFTTLERNVSLTFSYADLIERAYGNSQFKMDVWMNGSFDSNYTAVGLIEQNLDVLLGIHMIQLNDVDRYLDFAIQLYEYTPTCNNKGNIDQPYHGPGSCSFLSFAKLLDGENDLDARPAGATSWTEWTLQRTMERPAGLWPLYSDELRFEVPVSLKVTYTPVF